MSVAAIIPAAGSGQRLGAGSPKAFRLLAGRPMLRRAADSLAGLVDVLVVVAPAGQLALLPDLLADLDCRWHSARGGDTRQESVAAGLAVLPSDADIVLVHDAARPLMPASVVAAVIAAVRSGADAVVPVLPLVDTVKSVDGTGRVTATLDRSALVAAQTPQAFSRRVLERAHAFGGATGTDDAALVEALGIPVATVPGDPAGFKITTSYDVRRAELMIGAGR